MSATALPRRQLVDDSLPKIEAWMGKSKGKIRADVAHEKLVVMGFASTARTTRRAVARVRRNYKAGRPRVHRPWVTEPGMMGAVNLKIPQRRPNDRTTTTFVP